jgi:hypothetical protein
MKLSRIRFAFPWRIALILALLPCLPLLGFWAWFQWEVPPLQRYYLAAYWHSSETANQPDAQTQIRWLMETAPGRKRHWLFAFDVTEGSQNDLPLALSFAAAEQGWTGIERTPAESMDSTELEKLLREDFYDGKTFRQLMNEPLVYGVAAWVVVAYLAFMMRDDIGEEWRQLRREVSEPNGHRIMETIGPTIETGLSLEFGRELPIGLMRERSSSHGRTSALQSAVDPVSTSPQIQRVFVGVLDQYRRKFKTRFLLHGNSPLHSLRTLQSHRPSDGLSSPDRRHRMRHSRRQNRGTNRNGLSSSETSDVSESSGQIADQLRISLLNLKQHR